MKLIAPTIILLATTTAWTQSPPQVVGGIVKNPESSQAPLRIRVAGNVQQVKLVKKVQPVYPELAKQARIQGTVRLQATLATDGTVKEITEVSGNPLLVDPATEAVRQWRYEPTLLNGKPVEVVTTIDVVFTLESALPPVDEQLRKREQAALAEVDPETVQDIRRLLRAQNASSMMEQLAQLTLPAVKAELLKKLPAFEDREKVATRFVEKMRVRMTLDELLDVTVPIVAKHFTREELRGLVAFYESPLGRHYTQENVAMMGEISNAVGEHWRNVVVPEIIAEMAKESPDLLEKK